MYPATDLKNSGGPAFWTGPPLYFDASPKRGLHHAQGVAVAVDLLVRRERDVDRRPARLLRARDHGHRLLAERRPRLVIEGEDDVDRLARIGGHVLEVTDD